MKEKTPKEEKDHLKIRRYIRKFLAFFGFKFLFLWEKTCKLRKIFQTNFSSIVQLFVLSVTVLVLLVANKQRRIANEQQKITIRLQEIADKQLEIAQERQEWLREDRERIADVYLETTSVKPVDPDTVKLTFRLVNRGNDNAEDGRLLFYIADSLSPHLSYSIAFQAEPGIKGLVITLKDLAEPGVMFHNINSDNSYYSAKLPVVLSLKLTPHLKKEEEIGGVVYKFCFHRGCQKAQKLTFNNPFFGKE